ncbi:hypothetical protein DUI87_34096 [Hirundo rustica rustica]|uniref:Uncharacterized protein n=1 Tax=Hirundo rustica rustica TaxID=333673 RepID=A0A3M0IMC1_HIRRU|nr:hypothetical protein DUI87_34096 [Hirundo rustica rustica]
MERLWQELGAGCGAPYGSLTWQAMEQLRACPCNASRASVTKQFSLSGKTEIAAALCRCYDGACLSIDTVVKEAVANDGSQAGLCARELCTKAAMELKGKGEGKIICSILNFIAVHITKEQTLALRKEGIGVVLDAELPYLIGIDDDLLSTGIISYHLKEGQTYVGREDAIPEQDIVLHGLDLESEHCIFKNLNGAVNLIPLNGMQCSVNGIQITEPTYLNQGIT